MAKYSYEFKLKVVNDYLSGSGGYSYICKKYCIPQDIIVRRWVDSYQAFGEDALRRKRKNEKYSLDFKLKVVKLYLESEISYKDLAIKFNMNNPPLIGNWVQNFRMYGIDGLSKPKGRPPKMKPKENLKQPIKRESLTEDYVKELEQKVLYLEIENAYLKELRRLRQEETKAKKELQESLAASEKNTD